MNPFYIFGMIFFASYCSGQTEHTNPTINIDDENVVQCETHMPIHEIKYIWTIRNFSAHERLGKPVLSPLLRAPTTDRIEWELRLHPSQWVGGQQYVRLQIFISSESIVKEALAECNVSIINNKKEVLLHQHIESSSRRPEITVSWFTHHCETICKYDYFFRNHLLQNDTLKMFIYMKWFAEPSNDFPLQRKISSPPPTLDTAIMKNNLSEDFESMLKNTDVVFITKDGKYPAHKNILAARSPVFAAMFRRKNTKNEQNKKIRINETNMDEEVLHAMLRYIYTGKCENFEHLADKLLVAAAKYRLDVLWKICEQTLCETLSVKNAAKLLVFAEEHQADKLKSKAKEVISNSQLGS